ncbi:hypothetical protein BU16DRAFT_530070 [Lophium mytilinum]|uniref:Thioredoxin domain-containing protein n=1 Tax=Lophium mytilinum TaxID=390894 RepID=A0A6A6QHA0_9PEZI|nr:hypothetical protein BU16DRAFT_530070 [Lophium mytilinum]
MKYTKSKPRMAFKFLLFPALAIFFFFAIPKPTSVIDLSSSNFDVILSHKPTLVFFTASYPSCHWCHEIDPYFEQIASNFAYASDKLTIAKINASKQPALARQLNITQYPSLRWFDGKTASPQEKLAWNPRRLLKQTP